MQLFLVLVALTFEFTAAASSNQVLRGATAAESCTLSFPKEDCGHYGIGQSECEQRSCCWLPVSGSDEPWCYKPQQLAGATYTVTDRADEGTRSTLSLQLTNAVLPQYGTDFEHLSVLFEAQTPQRLHLKISPMCGPQARSGSMNNTSTARWEVPEWLLPRPSSQPFDPESALYQVELPQQGQPFQFTVARKACDQARQRQQQQQQRTGFDAMASVFDTIGSRLVFKDQYLEITTSVLPSTSLYGLGETIRGSGELQLPRDGRIITLWNYDIAASNPGINLYGSHPFLLQVNEDGLSSGVFLLNSNGMDIELQQTRVTYRVIGGVLDFYFFLGPSPEAVIQQYQEVVGRPAMPPYWALGLHQCRWGYQTLAEVEEVVNNYSTAGLPLEVIWTDIDYMYRYRDFTFDPTRFNVNDFRKFVDRLHAAGQRWVPISDCGIPHAEDDPAFVSGMTQGVFIRDATGQPYLGQVWPGATHYPDFLAVKPTWPWWRQQLQNMWEQVPFDGMWIDMNEASNFCEGEVCHIVASSSASPSPGSRRGQVQGPWWLHRLRDLLLAILQRLWPHLTNRSDKRSQAAVPRQHDPSHTSFLHTNCELACTPPSPDNQLAYPPYAINNLRGRVNLGSKTLPMTAQHLDGQLQYNTHNLYGLSEAAATRWAMQEITQKRVFVLSRSTFPGSGHHAAHWTGDNAATWNDLRWSILGLLNSNMWGIAMAGADICGFFGDTTEELCARWIAAGAFYTFTRNHNTLGAAPQELYRWPAVAAAARHSLALRYSLLPYLYTCSFKAHTKGGTVARPLFFVFPADATARDLSTQWMLGDSILIAPALAPSVTHVDAYLPAGTWYSLQHYNRYHGPATVKVEAPLTQGPPVFIRGGSIVAMQEPHNTTSGVRSSPVTLVVALDHHAPGNSAQRGSKHETWSHEMQKGHRQTSDGTGNAGSDDWVGDCNGVDLSLLLNKAAGQPGSRWKLSTAQEDSGLLLGCGMLYHDEGDSLDVPSDASTTVLFASMAQHDTQRGWVMVAAETYETGSRDRSTGAWESPDRAATLKGDSGRQSTVLESGSRSRNSRSSEGVAGVLTLAEVKVLGVQQPAVAGGQYVVWVDGVRLGREQVVFYADRQVLTVTSLQQQLAQVGRLEWAVEAQIAVE